MVDFHGWQRSNETHESTTDSDAQLAKRVRAKKPSSLTRRIADGKPQWTRRLDSGDRRDMLNEARPGGRRVTLAADEGYAPELIRQCREMNVTPHFAWKKTSKLDGRTTRHEGYALSQKVRKRIEETWGWMKTVAGFRKTRFRARPRTQHAAELTAAACNLLRIAKLATA